MPNPVGRPPYTEEQISAAKELYLELLAHGKNEREIEEVDSMPTWNIRSAWKKDPEFYAQCQTALEQGAEAALTKAERKLEETITRAEDEACPPQLPPLVKELMSHARWKAKCFSGKYKEKLDMNLGGQPENPVKFDGKIEIVHVKPTT